MAKAKAKLTDAELLQTLLDRHAITDLIYRYCRAIDRIDVELGHSVFHADATADHGDVYVGSGNGAIDHICERHRQALAHSHQVTNIILGLADDHATSEAYYVSSVRIMIDDRPMQITTWGRYLDEWSRRDERWGIDRRVVVVDLDEMVEAKPMTLTDRGRRDRSDPSYATLMGYPGR